MLHNKYLLLRTTAYGTLASLEQMKVTTNQLRVKRNHSNLGWRTVDNKVQYVNDANMMSFIYLMASSLLQNVKTNFMCCLEPYIWSSDKGYYVIIISTLMIKSNKHKWKITKWVNSSFLRLVSSITPNNLVSKRPYPIPHGTSRSRTRHAITLKHAIRVPDFSIRSSDPCY